MAELVSDLDAAEEVGEIEAVEKEIAAQPEPEVKTELPPKYKNKSIEEVVRMAEEADKMMNRHAQEVGEVRKLADELLRSQLARKPEVEKPKEVDFFENPQEAVRRDIESNPRLLAVEQQSLQIRQEMNRQRLAQAHPDMMNIVSDSEFIDWVKGSPIRMSLLTQADKNFDYDAGNELLSTFKQIKAVKQAQQTAQVSETEKLARSQSLKAASVDSGGTNESSKKVFRRADLLKLRQTDPDRYEAIYPEIEAAYREGRVK